MNRSSRLRHRWDWSTNSSDDSQSIHRHKLMLLDSFRCLSFPESDGCQYQPIYSCLPFGTERLHCSMLRESTPIYSFHNVTLLQTAKGRQSEDDADGSVCRGPQISNCDWQLSAFIFHQSANRRSSLTSRKEH